MRKIITVLCVLIVGYQGYSQNVTIAAFYPELQDTVEWSEKQIISALKQKSVLFCKLDLFLERNDTNFYVKNMELILKDSVFDSAYLESSVFYNEDRKSRKNIRCSYIVINDKWGSQLEITEEALRHLPILSKYLNKKVKKTRFKECKQGYMPMD